jgi:hypothetical protein
MPRFYFHFTNGEDVELDPDGLEFPSLEAAYLDAFRAAREMWTEMLQRQEDPRELAFAIHDGAGRLLLTLPFSEVLQSTKGSRPKRPLRGPDKLQHQIARLQRLRYELSGAIVSAQRTVEESRAVLQRSQSR